MASSPLPEDCIRTLSRLVFACTAPDQMTLRLFDPATRKLSSFLLVKVLDDTGDLHGPPPNDTSPPLQATLDELMERLKAVVREEILPNKTHRTSDLHYLLPVNCPFAGGSSATAKKSTGLTAAISSNSDVITSPCPPVRPTRQNAMFPALRSPIGAPPSRHPSGPDASGGKSPHNCGALNSAAKGERPPPRLDDGTVATTASACIETQLPAHPVVTADTPLARLCTPTKTKAHRAPHETLPPDAIDFPPFLVTSTPRAVARHRREARERTRRTSLSAHGVDVGFDLAAFDPETVSAAMLENSRRATIGVAQPTASIDWEKLRRSTAR
ncbi:hypothetical protein C8T65DRAFT_750408 [Cerioporus squamosus]|nr:hypothetical protein C8T65DRAFT_750408 [Cerioporus squamosus]